MRHPSPSTDPATSHPLLLPRPVGFVFSGGASSGALHVGMLRAAQEFGIRPDLVVGTSVGALHGALVAAAHADPAGRLGAIWRELERGDIFPTPDLRQLTRVVTRRRHLLSPAALSGLIHAHRPAERVEHLELPFAAVATDATDGRAVALDEGDLHDALLASSALPGVFPRVRIADRWYLDGGVAANVPVLQALSMGARSLIVFDATAARTTPSGPTRITKALLDVAGLLLRRQLERDLRSIPSAVPVVHFRAAPPVPVSPFDFSRTGELIHRGYERAGEELRRHRNLRLRPATREGNALALAG